MSISTRNRRISSAFFVALNIVLKESPLYADAKAATYRDFLLLKNFKAVKKRQKEKKMRNEFIMKPFEIDGSSSWCEAKRRSKGVLRIWPESQTIEVEMFAGCDPYYLDMLNFVLADKDVRRLIRNYQKSSRIERYAINVATGMSGRQDVYINFYDKYGLQIRGKHLLHVSCYDKLWGIKKIYVGDLVEAIYAMNVQPGEKTTAKYIKPYLEPEWASTDVHSIISNK